MANIGNRRSSNHGVKCITAALGHRRADSYLFANQQHYRGKSYRVLWFASRSNMTFEAWLRENGILAV